MKKKTIVVVLLLFTLFILLATPSFAYSGEGKEYYESFTEILPDNVSDVELSDIGVDSLFKELLSALREGLGSAFPLFALLFGIALLLALAESATPLDSGSFSPYMSAGVGAVSSLFIIAKLIPVIESTRESIEELSLFFSGLIPILSGILLSGGNVSSAASQAANMNITFSLVTLLLSRLLLPLTLALFSLSMLTSIDGGGISSLAKSIKGIYMWVLGIGTTIIISAFSMQSVISGAADSAYLRAAKYAASAMIPIVGSTVSGALGTLAGGLSYVKSTVGATSVFVIAVIALAPLLKLLLSRFAFSVSIAFLELIGSSGAVRLYTSFRSALDVLTALYAAVSVVYISELIIFLKSGVSVFG